MDQLYKTNSNPLVVPAKAELSNTPPQPLDDPLQPSFSEPIPPLHQPSPFPFLPTFITYWVIHDMFLPKVKILKARKWVLGLEMTGAI
jgi:hypothetical protein